MEQNKKKLFNVPRPINRTTLPNPQSYINIPNIKKLDISFDFETNNHTATYFQEENGRRVKNTTSFSDGIKIQGQIEVDIKKPSECETQVINLYNRGYTQTEIAEALEISQSTVSRILSQKGYRRK